ncbi:MAG: tetratricopeptide repeat protein [Planctomycetota bacterium]|nr:tetratricopeptide repeat protein [Planctomycetota bacterium]
MSAGASKKWDEALKVYERFAANFENDRKTRLEALTARGDTLRDAGRVEESEAAYRKVVEIAGAEEPSLNANARLQIAYLYKDRVRDYEKAIAEFKEVEKADPKDESRVAASLNGSGDCHLALKRPKEAFACYKRMLQEFSRNQPHWVVRPAKQNAVRAVMEAANWDEGIPFLAEIEASEGDYRLRADLAINHAHALRQSGKKAEARADYVRCQAYYASEADYLYACQKGVVELWVEEGKAAEALKAAKSLYDVASNDRLLIEACTIAAAQLKAVDGHLQRANEFLKFQKFGPLGPDGKPGGDDPSNPLAEVSCDTDPARLKLLQEGFDKTGDSDAGARQRAYLLILMGKPKEALGQFRAQFARCSEDGIQRAGAEWVVVGVKAVQGHVTELKPFYEWLNYGPGGKDGKGPKDDPFKALEGK